MTSELVHVAVAVIMKKDRVLLSRRAKNVHQGGLWEFPGGKVKAGENVTKALSREIQEELDINIKYSHPLIKIRHHYKDKSVLLDTYKVIEFGGREYNSGQKQFGAEGQEVRWVKIEELKQYHFPAANRAIIDALELPENYVISPDCSANTDNIEIFLQHFSITTESYQMMQLRLKSLQGKALDLLVKRACQLARQNQVCLLLNSALIKLLGGINDEYTKLSDGLHLTSKDLYENEFIAHYRQKFPDKRIAASCHNRQDIEQANKLEVDFIVVSPVKSTTSHPNQEPLGWQQFELLLDMARMPAYALGGMSQEEMTQAKNSGAQGIAAIRSLWMGSEILR